MDNKVLTHHGIKGMQWGKRRYQNVDGSLTDAGKKRYRQDISDFNRNTKEGRKNPKTADLRKETKFDKEQMVDEWVTKDMTSAKRAAEESASLARKLKEVNDNSIRNTSKVKMDLSKMTDQQMRTEINRALLERQYNDMFAPQKSTKGREYMSKILDGTVATLGIASTALGIAVAIKDLRR